MRAVAIFILLASLSVSGAAAESWVVEGRVVAVADGNTITILDLEKHQHKIRFNGIDAPEKKQPFGNRSRQNLASLIFARNVRASSWLIFLRSHWLRMPPPSLARHALTKTWRGVRAYGSVRTE